MIAVVLTAIYNVIGGIEFVLRNTVEERVARKKTIG